jgi:hypothetical protein
MTTSRSLRGISSQSTTGPFAVRQFQTPVRETTTSPRLARLSPFLTPADPEADARVLGGLVPERVHVEAVRHLVLRDVLLRLAVAAEERDGRLPLEATVLVGLVHGDQEAGEVLGVEGLGGDPHPLRMFRWVSLSSTVQ